MRGGARRHRLSARAKQPDARRRTRGRAGLPPGRRVRLAGDGQRLRAERADLVLARSHDAAGRLGHSFQAPLRSRSGSDDEARLVAEAAQHLDLGVELRTGPASWSRTVTATGPRWSSGRPRSTRRPWSPRSSRTGCSTPCLRAVAAPGRPPARPRSTGSSVSPQVSARKNRVSESVEPSMSGNSDGSTAISRSRFRSWNPAMEPLCIHSQRPCRKRVAGCCAAPGSRSTRGRARTAAASRPGPRSRAGSGRLHAGSTLLNTAGVSPVPYQPIPKPSPFVVVAPIQGVGRSISEWTGRNRAPRRGPGPPVRHPSAHGTTEAGAAAGHPRPG